MRRRRVLCAVAAGAVPLSGCSVIGDSGSDDSGSGDGADGYSCPPADRSEAALLIEDTDSDRFLINGSVYEKPDARQADGRDVPGANATFRGPDDFPYEVTIPIWGDESIAADAAADVDATDTRWAGETIELETGLTARIGDVTVVMHTLRSEHREKLLELLGAIPCVTEDDIVATSWE